MRSMRSRASPTWDCVALKLHPSLHGYHVADHGLLDPVFEQCAKYKLPVLINALDDAFCAPFAIEEIAKDHPDVPTIIAHMGAVWNVPEAIIVARTPAACVSGNVCDPAE
jgi:predicted TIM-barrel fold metal-dependent hydrolase